MCLAPLYPFTLVLFVRGMSFTKLNDALSSSTLFSAVDEKE